MIPTWAQLLYLAGAVAFILALKGLSGPKTARVGNLIGAGAAVLACAIPFFYVDDMQHVPLILVAIAVGSAGGFYGARVVQMTQMPQMVALFNGVGGGAAALVALVELHHAVATRTILSSWPNSTISCSSTRATSAAAPPPTPLNSATICGIWVICTTRAP